MVHFNQAGGYLSKGVSAAALHAEQGSVLRYPFVAFFCCVFFFFQIICNCQPAQQQKNHGEESLTHFEEAPVNDD